MFIALLNIERSIMEPISILSIVVQLATSAPALNKLISTEKTLSYSRTETIEIYRNVMNSPYKVEPDKLTQQ